MIVVNGLGSTVETLYEDFDKQVGMPVVRSDPYDIPASETKSIATYAAHLLSQVEQYRVKNTSGIHLVGLSLGALVVASAARKMSKQQGLRSVTLVGSSDQPQPDRWLPKMPTPVLGMRIVDDLTNFGWLFGHRAKTYIFLEQRRAAAEGLGQYASDIAHLTVPTHFVMAAEDEIVPLTAAQKTLQTVRKKRDEIGNQAVLQTTVCEGLGHLAVAVDRKSVV